MGNTLETHVQVNETEYLKTLYIYTTAGRLKYVIQPEGVKALGTGSTLTAATLETWAFQYTYDNRGRLTEKKVPGTTPVYIVYDQLDRPVLVQDGNLRASKKWYFTKYDRDNRPVYGGIVALTATSMDTRAELQAYMDNLNYEETDPYYEIRNTSSTFHYYSQQTKPNVTAADIHTVYYYDDYNFNNDASNTRDISYVQKGVGTASEVSYTHQRGRLTQLKRKVLESTSSNWLQTYYFYDKEGRALQVRSNNHLNAAQEDFYTLEYTTEGRINREEEIHRVNGITTTVKRRYLYQSNGQLGKVYQQNNTDPETLIAYYKYNPLGQLIEKNLAYKGSGDINSSDSYLQSIDLRYNIRGWLSSINNSKLTNNGTTNDDNTDIFGLELAYNMQDAGIGNQRFYNGNIAGVKWITSDILNENHPRNERSYAYDYDKADRLTDANFKAIGTTVENGAYTVNDILYDANGNIQSLNRYSKASSAQTPVKIDDLSYNYSGNRLTKVTDSGSSTLGFKGSTTQEQAYLYDANGNMVQDHSNNRAISYNELNKVKAVEASQGNKMVYSYDGTGTRLKKAVYSNNALTLTTDYIGSFIYENGVLASLAMPEGRVVKVEDRMEYQYVIKDHQGNSRMTFRKVIIHEDGTMEPASREEELLQFDNYDEVTRISGSLPNKTAGGNTAMRLSGAPGEIIGLAKSMKVKAGDVVKMEVNAKYPKPPKKSTSSAVAVAMGASFANAFGMTAVGEGTQRELFSFFNELFAAGPVFDRREKNDVPKAYINYLLFNKDHVLVDAGFQPVTEAALETGENGEHERLSLEAQVEEEGFMYIYVSNENEQIADVWFDEMSVTTTTLEVIQENHFYPFGMPMQGIAVNTPVPTGPDKHIYNGGSELQDELGEARYSTFFREYDASLGRFFAVDPMADMYSNQTPYQYGNNDPNYWNDPSGAAGAVFPGYEAWRPRHLEGGGNPGFHPALWHQIVDLWKDTDDKGSSVWTPESGSHFYDSNGDEVDRSGERIPGGGKYETYRDQNNRIVGVATFYLSTPSSSPNGISAVSKSEIVNLTVAQNGGNCPTCLDPSTVGNWFYNYGGPNNPKSNNGEYNYSVSPKNISDAQSYSHDLNYDEKRAVGGLDLVLNTSVIDADIRFVQNQFNVAGAYLSQFRPTAVGFMYVPNIDPYTNQPIGIGTASKALIQGVGLGIISLPKIIIWNVGTKGPF